MHTPHARPLTQERFRSMIAKEDEGGKATLGAELGEVKDALFAEREVGVIITIIGLISVIGIYEYGHYYSY